MKYKENVMPQSAKTTICLWFAGDAEEAAGFLRKEEQVARS
jgi:hypothetical protein